MIQYEFDPIPSIAIVTMSGDLGDAEALLWFRGFLEDVRGAKRVSGIVDTRELEELNVTGETIRQMTDLAKASEDAFAGSRWAFVASKDVVFGMARMYQSIRDGAPYEIHVFREMGPARE